MQLKYAINTSKPMAEIQLIDGSIKVPANGWTDLTINEAEHADVRHCVRRGWLKITDIEPKTERAPEPEDIEISKIETAGSSTPPRKRKEKPTDVPGIKTTRLGQPDTHTKKE